MFSLRRLSPAAASVFPTRLSSTRLLVSAGAPSGPLSFSPTCLSWAFCCAGACRLHCRPAMIAAHRSHRGSLRLRVPIQPFHELGGGLPNSSFHLGRKVYHNSPH